MFCFSAWSDGESEDGSKTAEGKKEQDEESPRHEEGQSRNWEKVMDYLLPKMLLIVLK